MAAQRGSSTDTLETEDMAVLWLSSASPRHACCTLQWTTAGPVLDQSCNTCCAADPRRRWRAWVDVSIRRKRDRDI